MISATDIASLHDHFYRSGTKRRSQMKGHLISSFVGLCIVNFLCAIDSTILSVALPSISDDLHGSAIQAFWTGTAFLLASAVFQPLWASLSDVFGSLNMILIALALFTFGSCLILLTESFPLLLSARSIQGIGAGGLLALTYVITTSLVGLRERGKWFGLISVQWAAGSAIGPIIGGTIAQSANWRWMFWLNMPFCILGFIIIPLTLHLHENLDGMLTKLLAQDWIGALVFISSLTTFLVPLTWGGVVYEWKSAMTLVPLLLGLASLVCFSVYNALFSKKPFIRNTLFSNSTSCAAYFGAAIHGILVYCLLYYIPLYFEVAKDYSAIRAALALFPYTLSIGPAAIITGILISRTGRFRVYLWIGWAITTLGIGLLLALHDDPSIPGWVFIGLVGGVGLGIVWSAGSFAAQASSSDVDLPHAAAMFTFFRAVGQALGVALGGVIFQNVFKGKIKKDPFYAIHATHWSQDATALIYEMKNLTDPAQQKLKGFITVACIDSFHVIWLVLCILSAIAVMVNCSWIQDINFKEKSEERHNDLGHQRAMTPEITVHKEVQNGKTKMDVDTEYPGAGDWI